MKRIFRWVIGVAATVVFLLGCLSFGGASLAYDEAGRWFARATYNAQCTSTALPGCGELLRQQPHWPGGVVVTDKDVLLAEAGALHNTGSGVLSLGGLLMATAGVLLASNVLSAPRIGVNKRVPGAGCTGKISGGKEITNRLHLARAECAGSRKPSAAQNSRGGMLSGEIGPVISWRHSPES